MHEIVLAGDSFPFSRGNSVAWRLLNENFLVCIGQGLGSPMDARVHPLVRASHGKKCGQKKAACR